MLQIMLIPKLDPSTRDREFKLRNFEEISRVVYTWLFFNDSGHREMDRDILGLDPVSSKGWQSMGVLHFLGLKREFKGIFQDVDLHQAIQVLKSDEQDFSYIIQLLERTYADYDEMLSGSIYEVGKSKDKDFDKHFKLRLQEMNDTDGISNKAHARKEQAALRGILFKSELEATCAICLRAFPTEIMVAGHIKPRSKCSTKERLDPNVVMPVCKVGCDDFFEKGYIIVDQSGVVQSNEEKFYSKELQGIVNSLAGNICPYFKAETESYFSDRRNLLIED